MSLCPSVHLEAFYQQHRCYNRPLRSYSWGVTKETWLAEPRLSSNISKFSAMLSIVASSRALEASFEQLKWLAIGDCTMYRLGRKTPNLSLVCGSSQTLGPSFLSFRNMADRARPHDVGVLVLAIPWCQRSRKRRARSFHLQKEVERKSSMIAVLPGSTKYIESKACHKVLQQPKIKIAPATLRKALLFSHLRARKIVNKPMLTETLKQECRQWAEGHKDWTVDDWRSVISKSTDHLRSDGKQHCWIKGAGFNSKLVRPTLKYGGFSTMVWGCTTYKGVGTLQVIKGRMNRHLYIVILSRFCSLSSQVLEYTRTATKLSLLEGSGYIGSSQTRGGSFPAEFLHHAPLHCVDI